MKLTARECYRNYVGGEVRVAIRGLNKFSNFCGFLEGPHIDILSAPCGGKETGGRTQVYWHAGARHPGFYYHKGDAHARVSLNATKCRVAHRLHKGYHALSVELPDGRLWFLNPANPNDAGAGSGRSSTAAPFGTRAGDGLSGAAAAAYARVASDACRWLPPSRARR